MTKEAIYKICKNKQDGMWRCVRWRATNGGSKLSIECFAAPHLDLDTLLCKCEGVCDVVTNVICFGP